MDSPRHVLTAVNQAWTHREQTKPEARKISENAMLEVSHTSGHLCMPCWADSCLNLIKKYEPRYLQSFHLEKMIYQYRLTQERTRQNQSCDFLQRLLRLKLDLH